MAQPNIDYWAGREVTGYERKQRLLVPRKDEILDTIVDLIPKERRYSINGVCLWTAIQGRGLPMVLCHGGPGAYDYLEPVAAMVDDLCQVLRYDQRGSGRSQAAGPYDVATLVQDLEGLRKYFGFAQWIVGGHSWGAGLALAYAVQYPHRTTAVVYISGTGIDPRWHDEYRRNRLAALGDAERQEFQRLRTRREHACGEERDRLQRRLRMLSRQTDVFDVRRVDDLPSFREHPTSEQVNQQVGSDWEACIEQPAFRRAVYSLSMPVLLFHGAGDPRPARYIEALAARLVDGRFHCISEAGHFPWIEQPGQVRASLRTFIAEIERGNRLTPGKSGAAG
jgi:proline iminopeptidase